MWLKLIRNDQLILSVLAVLVGAAAAYGAIAFRLGIDGIQYLFYGSTSESVLSVAMNLPWWHRLLAPAVGGLGVGILVHFVMTHRRPEGIADVIQAGALHGGHMSLRNGLGAALISAGSIGAGASVGREGPVVHLGASLASWVAQRLRLNRSMTMTLLGCGVASAVAASFNAPIAGVIFALEVVVGHYGLGAFAPVVIAGVVGTVIARVHLGDFPAFVVPGAELASFSEMPAFALLGVAAALVAIAFMIGIMFVARTVERIPIPRIFYPAGGGLLVGAIAAFYPEVIGVGYETTDQALGNTFTFDLLIIILIAKTAATCISLGSGFGGGVFSPSLCIGALLGAAFGIVAVGAAPSIDASIPAYSMVGMGAVAGAVLGAPISTILIIFELTGDFTLTVAVMIAVSISTLLVRQVLGKTFFTWQLEQRGIDLEHSHERQICRSIPIRRVMTDRFTTVPDSADAATLRALVKRVPDTEFYVVDSEGRLIGELSFHDMKDVILESETSSSMTAGELASSTRMPVAETDSLDLALQQFDTSDKNYLPVVDNHESCRLTGVIAHREAVVAYNQALLRLRAEEQGRI